MRNDKGKTNRNTSLSLQDNLRAAAAVAIFKRSIRRLAKYWCWPLPLQSAKKT